MVIPFTPYSWSVTSTSIKILQEDKKNETWQFYKAALGVAFYAPFPAIINTPARAATVTPVSYITLMWAGNDDVDNMTFYDVYFDVNSTPVLYTSDVMQSS